MKVASVEVKNFRLLKNTTICLEDNLSLVIGKNNTGKTSLLKIMQYFIGNDNRASTNQFSFDDFNVNAQDVILELIKTPITDIENFKAPSISLTVNIEYNDDDNLNNVSKIIMDLDDSSNKLIILFRLELSYENYRRLIDDFNKIKEVDSDETFNEFIKNNYTFRQYFEKKVYAVDPTDNKNMAEISPEYAKSILVMEVIDAKRDVSNSSKSKILANLAQNYYEDTRSDNDNSNQLKIHEALRKSDIELSKAYEQVFATVISDIKTMSYGPDEANIAIESNLNDSGLFRYNTAVSYKHDKASLPEDYSGLGYLNLFAIAFSIRIKINSLTKSPAPIKILFIEEPEAHTHPQMQYVFIKNIKEMLQDCASSTNISLQTIISSHSAQIVSQCDFNDVKYFKRNTECDSVEAFNLSSLEDRMTSSGDDDVEAAFRFVKQYITLDKAEIFFADKAILIEGDTERILMSAMMQKIDNENKDNEAYQKAGNLLSQNIAILEVGAYAQHFKYLIDFLGIKTLVITDLDTVDKDRRAVPVDSNVHSTSNTSLKDFFSGKSIEDIMSFSDNDKILSSDDNGATWKSSDNGILRIAYQTEENRYTGRSFEDAFLSVNMKFVAKNKDQFNGLKCREEISESSTNYYGIAQDCIEKKTSFALDILLNGDGDNESWKIPSYMHEGLVWLQK